MYIYFKGTIWSFWPLGAELSYCFDERVPVPFLSCTTNINKRSLMMQPDNGLHDVALIPIKVALMDSDLH